MIIVRLNNTNNDVKYFKLGVNNPVTIRHVKTRIFETTKIPINQQKIVYEGEEKNDNEELPAVSREDRERNQTYTILCNVSQQNNLANQGVS